MNELERIGWVAILKKFHCALAEQCTKDKRGSTANRNGPQDSSVLLSQHCAKVTLPLLMSDFGIHKANSHSNEVMAQLLADHKAVMTNWGNLAIQPEKFAHLRRVANAITGDHAKPRPLAAPFPVEDFVVQRSPFVNRQ
jgi:hypothetical protein